MLLAKNVKALLKGRSSEKEAPVRKNLLKSESLPRGAGQANQRFKMEAST